MFNRYTQLKRDGGMSEEDKSAADSKLRRRAERQRRKNTELATRATKRVEQWMVSTLDDDAPAVASGGAKDTNVFNFDFRKRDKSRELEQAKPGGHTVSPSKYVTVADQIANQQEYMAKGFREFKEPWVPIRFGESPFRKREEAAEINPPVRFKAVTDIERVADSRRSQLPAWTDTGDDPTRVPQMGFDDIPVAMENNAVCVRAKAKAPLSLRFKLTSCPGDLNPRTTSWTPDPYTDACEPSGYGMSCKKNNSRIRVPEKEVSDKCYLSAVRGKKGQLAVLGEVSSHRKDRRALLNKPAADGEATKGYYGGVKNVLTMSGTFRPGVDEDVTATKQLASQVMAQRNAAREKSIANGTNIYAWNDLFKYKDHHNF